MFTASSVEQRTTEDSCLRLFEKSETNISDLDDYPKLNRTKTVSFLLKGLHKQSLVNNSVTCKDNFQNFLRV